MDTVVQKKLNQILNKETTITSVANELGVSRQTLYKWLNQYKRQRGFPIFETQQKSHKAHNKISKDIEDLVISTAKNNPNDSVSTLATKLVTTYGVQLNPTTIFRVLKRNNIRYTPAVVPVRAPTALYVPETIPVSTELPTAKLSQDVLPHVAPTQLLSVTKAATVPTSALSPHALALPSYFLRQLTAFVLVGVFGVVSLYGAYQFDGNTSSFTSGEPTASPNFEVASKVVSVFDEVNPSPLSPSTFSLTSLTDSLASLVKQGPRIAKLTLLPLETYQSFALGGYTVEAQRAPSVTNANAASFLDRLSLTVFCSLSANKDASRCSYDTLLALRGTPDTTTILGYPVEETPTVVAVATSTPSTTQPSPRIVYVPQYITNYVTEYVLGTPGKDGKDGKDGTTTTLVNNTSIPSGFGSYSIPSVTSPSLIGATTIGYLRDATIEKATVSDSIFNGYNLFNNTAIFTGFVGINSLAATTSVLTNATITTSTTTDAFISNLSSTNNLFTNATTTNSYISALVASSSTLTDALLTNSTTTRAYIANLIASSSTLQDALLTNATTTNAYIQNLVAASSSVTDALFTNATTTNFVATNATSTSLFAQALTAVSSFFTNLTATNATTTNLIATNATSTNLFAGTGFVTNLTTTAATSTNLFSTNAFFTNLDATNINLGNATTTNFVATNATTTSLFTQNLAVGNATTQGNQTVNGDLTVNGTTTIAGNITLGTSTATYVSFNGLINSNVVPAANKMYDLGSPSFYWRDLYADNINVNTISAASTTISGTSNNTFSINSDNASTDAEDVSLIFFRGLVTPNALLRWNASTKRLESNMSFKVQNETPITGTTTLTVQAGAGQGTTNLLEVKNIGGTNLTVIDANGWVGIGSSTPSNPLTVIGNSFLGGNVTATGTISSPDAVITNATSTFFAAVNATTTNATTTRAYITSLVAASSTLQDALTTRSTTTDAYITRLVAASSTLQDAIVTTLNATNATVTSLLATNATTTNFASTNATSTNFFASVLNAVSAVFNSLTSGSITATSSLTSNGTLNVTGQTTLTTASSTGLTATNLYGTNATLTNATSTNFFTSLLNAVTAGFTNLTTTGTTTLATGGGRVGVGTGSPLGKLQVVTTSSDGNVATWGDGQFVVGQSGNTGGLGVSYDTSLNSSFISSLAPGIDWKDLGFRANNYNFFVNGGTQVMKITNTGNVGVGTTTPSAKLDINSSGTAVNIYDTVTSNIRLSIGTAGSPDFRASLQTYQHNTGGILGNLTLQENGGNVGIGTTSPTQKLEVQQGNIRINSPDQSLARLQINNTGISGREYALVSGVPNVGQTGFTLYDMTANASRLVVDAAGNVGMGTVSPEGRLTISGGSLASTGDAGHALSISSGLTTGRLLGGGSAVVSSLHTYYDSNAVEVTAGSTAGHVSGITIGARSYNGTAGSDAVALWTRNTQRLTVDATGNVGIGTTNPGAKLDINGNLSINAQHAIDFTNLNPNLRVIGVGEITIGDDDSVILSPQAGNVGIGTTNPAFTSGTGLEIERNGTATLRLDSQVYGTELRGLTNGTELMQLSAGYLALGTANTERMRIDSTGNIGVGTGSPQEKVDVVGSVLISAANANDNDSPGFIGVSNDDFLYNGLYLNHYGLGFHDPTQSANLGAYFSGYGGIDLFTSGANRVSIVENGNVGIGTTNPTAKLDISSAAANTPIIKLTSQEAGGDGYFMNFGYGSINHDSAGAVYTNWGSHYNGTTNAWVRDYTGLPLVNTQLSTSGDFVVNTDTATSGTPSFSSRFIVANNGNVGIGTTNPRAKLDILNSAALNRVLIRSSAANAANNGGSVDFHGVYTSGGTDVVPLASIAGRKVNGVSSDVQGYLQFNVTNTFGTPNEVMRIVGDLSGGTGGNVGIGTTTPEEKLDIYAGNIGVYSGALKFMGVPGVPYTDIMGDSVGLSFRTNVGSNDVNGTAMFIDRVTRNVGIGTTLPQTRLHVLGAANQPSAIASSTGIAEFQVSTTQTLAIGGQDSGPYGMWLQTRQLNPGYTGQTFPLLLNPVGGNVGIGTTNPSLKLEVTAGAGLTPLALTSGTERWEVGQNAGAGSSDNSFGFYSSTYGAGHSYAPIMTMLNTGNVGIGATIPTAKLDIYNSTNAEMRLSTLSDGYLQMGQFTNGAYIGTSSSDPTDGVLRFGTAGSERVRVGSTGNVGIGSTDPADKLTVQGKVRLDYGGALGTSARYGNLVMSGNEGFSLIGDGTIPTTPGSDINIGPNQGYGQIIGANWYYDGSTFDTYTRNGGSGLMIMCTQNVGDCAAGDFLFKTAGAGTAGTSIGYSTPFVIKQGGNIGIGAAAPNTALEVTRAITFASVDTFPQFIVKDAAGGTGRQLGVGVDAGGFSFIQSLNRGIDVMPLSLQRYGGNVGIGTAAPSSLLSLKSATDVPQLRLVQNNTDTAGYTLWNTSNGGDLVFSRYASSVDTERVRFTAAGSVGIGTSTISGALDVTSNSTFNLLNLRGKGLGSGLISMDFYNTSPGGRLYRFIVGDNDSSDLAGSYAILDTNSGNARRFVLTSTGNIGIGTSTPGSRLDVFDSTSSSNVNVFRVVTNVGSSNNVKFRIDSDGDVFTDGGTTIGTPADLAENYPALEALDAGTVVAFGSSTVAWEQADDNASSTQSYDISGVQKATNGYEAVGVVSTKAGITLGGNTTNGVPIALAGRVPVKVTAENGEVKRGDYLTVSNTMPGYAMKLTQTGRVIGRALSDSVSGRDKVMMYIENGYQQIDLSSSSATTTLLTKGNLALDANGVAIINIKSLSSANGTWSIDENGRIVAKALCIDGTCLDGPGFKDLVEGNGGTPKNGAMHIIGAHAFLLSATTHTLRVLDIAAGDNPVIVASLTLPEGVTSLSANGTYLYVNNSDLSMLYIVDVTSPTQPTLLRSINTGLATEIGTPPGVPEETSDDTATSTEEGGAEEGVPLVESEPGTEPEVVEGESETEESPLTEEEPVNTEDNAPLSSLDSPETTSTP